MSAHANGREPLHEPALPVVVEEAAWVHEAANRFEHADANELLAWALESFHPRMAISAAGGVDGMAIIDMAWRIDPEVRVFTLDTGRLPAETYALFEEVRERYGINVEFEYPDSEAISALVGAEGPNLMYRSVDLRIACCEIRKVDPLKRKLATLDAWVSGLRREQWRTRKNIAKVELDRDHGGIVKLNPLADWTLDEVWDYVRTNEVPYHELFDHGYVDRLRTMHAGGPARRDRARRQVVVGGTNRQGVRDPLLGRSARDEVRCRA